MGSWCPCGVPLRAAMRAVHSPSAITESRGMPAISRSGHHALAPPSSSRSLGSEAAAAPRGRRRACRVGPGARRQGRRGRRRARRSGDRGRTSWDGSCPQLCPHRSRRVARSSVRQRARAEDPGGSCPWARDIVCHRLSREPLRARRSPTGEPFHHGGSRVHPIGIPQL
jgi:hypothetical protein